MQENCSIQSSKLLAGSSEEATRKLHISSSEITNIQPEALFPD